MNCSKCGRSHTGICGIPAGVTRGFGARIGGIRKDGEYRMNVKAGAKSEKVSSDLLDKLLGMAREHETKLKAMLTALPPVMPEYDELQQRLDKILGIIETLNRQIAGR